MTAKLVGAVCAIAAVGTANKAEIAEARGSLFIVIPFVIDKRRRKSYCIGCARFF
jgi:hypothetical protein